MGVVMDVRVVIVVVRAVVLVVSVMLVPMMMVGHGYDGHRHASVMMMRYDPMSQQADVGHKQEEYTHLSSHRTTLYLGAKIVIICDMAKSLGLLLCISVLPRCQVCAYEHDGEGYEERAAGALTEDEH